MPSESMNASAVDAAACSAARLFLPSPVKICSAGACSGRLQTDSRPLRHVRQHCDARAAASQPMRSARQLSSEGSSVCCSTAPAR